jgi:hypothetical protein
MIFGSSQAKIELNLEKKSFSPNETIRGEIRLITNKPIKAKELNILFAGVGILVLRSPIGKNILNSPKEPTLNLNNISLEVKGVGGGVSVGTVGRSEAVHPFFNKEKQLDGEKEYNGGCYKFELQIPNDVLTKSENWASNIPFANLSKQYHKNFVEWNEYTKWFIQARLKIAFGKDIKECIEIKIV